MDGVKLDLRLLDLYGHLHLVVGLRHSLELPDSVGGESPPLGPKAVLSQLFKLFEYYKCYQSKYFSGTECIWY